MCELIHVARWTAERGRVRARAHRGPRMATMRGMAKPYAIPRFLAVLDEYDRAFQWIGLCLACGHAPADTHAAMQRLYLAHQAQRPGVDLLPLLSAHWEVVNAAEAAAAAPSRHERLARQQLVRRACLQHGQVLQDLRRCLQEG